MKYFAAAALALAGLNCAAAFTQNCKLDVSLVVVAMDLRWNVLDRDKKILLAPLLVSSQQSRAYNYYADLHGSVKLNDLVVVVVN